jgi:shikimate kinase
MSIQQIFADSGEQTFRDLESTVLAVLARLEGHVLALGGGAVVRPENRRSLAGRGKVVWLKASPELLPPGLQPIQPPPRGRPNLTGRGGLDEIRQLLAEREPIYQACADLVLDAEQQPPEALAEQIAAAFHLKAAT